MMQTFQLEVPLRDSLGRASIRRLCAVAVCVVLSLPLAGSVESARADDEVDRVLAKFDHEPAIREVQRAAIKYYNVSPSRIASLRSRTRSKALVPAISLGFSNSLSSYNLSVDDIIFRNVDDGIARYEDQRADFLGFTASASWSLERLVFNAEELDVMSLIGIQDGVQREVTALYYVRRRLQIELLLNPPTSLPDRLSAKLRLEELTGLLDAYTGGYFSKTIDDNSSTAQIPSGQRGTTVQADSDEAEGLRQRLETSVSSGAVTE